MSRSSAAKLYLALGVTLIGLSPVVFIWSRVGERSLPVSFPLVSVGLGFIAVDRSRRMRAKLAREVRRADPRPPITFLRSFRDDGKGRPSISFASLMRAWFDEGQLLPSSYEERAARAVREFGPFLAIGKPGEPLPELGAAREYVDDRSWRQTVLQSLIASRLVIIQAGTSDGLRWEIANAFRLLRPEQLVLLLPYGLRERSPRRRDEYERFRVWTQGFLPQPLPDEILDSFLVAFGPDWEPRLVSTGRDASRDSGRLPGDPFLEALGREFASTPKKDALTNAIFAAVLLVGGLFVMTRMIQPQPRAPLAPIDPREAFRKPQPTYPAIERARKELRAKPTSERR